jgi:hypothetical protein
MDLKDFEQKKEEKKGRKPDVKGSISVAGWFEETREGKRYLNVQIGNALYVKLFPYEEPKGDGK